MPADIIPINPSMARETAALSRDAVASHSETQGLDEEFLARVWRDAIETSRVQRAKTEAQWGRIGSLILNSCHEFERRHDEPDAWPLDEGLFSFVQSALNYYMGHANRFGIDKNGRPKSKVLVRKDVSHGRKGKSGAVAKTSR
jgi:hypothetical protein